MQYCERKLKSKKAKTATSHIPSFQPPLVV